MLTYRREIDGLRTVAVIPVVLFHAGIDLFGGGYVGVDVFFVISGYLITSIILAEKSQENFTLTGFYERRARRILPALFLVMLACFPFAWLFLMPSDFREFFKSVSYVPAFLQNILFYKQSGYFDTASELKPLLHTWSLAVEEQYYLVVPFMLLAVWRFGRSAVIAVLSIVAGLSFIYAQIAVGSRPAAAFFLLPARMWELFLGAFVALFFHWNEAGGIALARRTRLCQVGSVAGLVLMLFAVFCFDDRTPFPGLAALVPTVGAALVILFANPDTVVGRLLGTRLLVSLGLISYSIYLWHQPLFAFARHKLTHPSPIVFAGLVIAAIGLAYLSWRFVEKPFRDRQRIGRRRLAIVLVSASVFFVVIGHLGKNSDGLASRLNARQQELLAYKSYASGGMYRQGKCLLDEGQTFSDFDRQCFPAPNGVLLWGDSHAAALSVGLRERESGLAQLTSFGCPPMLGTIARRRVGCDATNDFVLGVISDAKPSVVILHANWLLYIKADPATALEKTIRSIKQASPETRIAVLGGVPQWHPSLPELLIRQGREDRLDEALLNTDSGQLVRLDQRLAEVVQKSGAQFVSARDFFCRGDDCSISVDLGGKRELVAWDYGHLTASGSRFLAGEFLSVLEKAAN